VQGGVDVLHGLRRQAALAVAAATREQVPIEGGELLSADLSELDLVCLMIDGVHFGEHTCVVALGIAIDGTKHPWRWSRAQPRTPPWPASCWSACASAA